MTRRILILANPVSGGGHARVLAPRLAAALQDRGLQTETFFSTHRGHAQERAARAGLEPWDALAAVGGDGTALEVLNGMPDPSRPLAVLPVGTANVLAAEYRLPSSPELLAERIASGGTVEHAIGLAGDRRFLLFCGAGHDGAAVERLERSGTRLCGKKKWVLPIVSTVCRWATYRLTAIFPDGERLTDLTTVLVTRVRNYGGSFALTPGIDPGDGRLHVLCFRARSRLSWIGLGLRAFASRLQPCRHLAVRATTAVRIEGAAPYHLDGDHAGTTPIDIRLGDRPARLFADPVAAPLQRAPRAAAGAR